jgi:hypothetical protein
MCTVAINVLERRAFNPESQHLIKFHMTTCGQQPGGDEAHRQMRGVTQA